MAALVDEQDLFGRFFLRCAGPATLATYYASVDAVRPLLASTGWSSAVSGWYLNNCHGFAARVSYFTSTPRDVAEVVRDFLAHTAGAVFEHQPPELPKSEEIAGPYGGEEVRFRRFLSTYSPVALDIMHADLLHARCLCITLRCQLFPERRPYRPHMEPTMLRESRVYAAFSPAERDRFWSDFQHWPNPPQVYWAHMFVNMVLGFDFNAWFVNPPPRSKTLDEINRLLRAKKAGFQVPGGWRP
jgi:hypothetical protein